MSSASIYEISQHSSIEEQTDNDNDSSIIEEEDDKIIEEILSVTHPSKKEGKNLKSLFAMIKSPMGLMVIAALFLSVVTGLFARARAGVKELVPSDLLRISGADVAEVTPPVGAPGPGEMLPYPGTGGLHIGAEAPATPEQPAAPADGTVAPGQPMQPPAPMPPLPVDPSDPPAQAEKKSCCQKKAEEKKEEEKKEEAAQPSQPGFFSRMWTSAKSWLPWGSKTETQAEPLSAAAPETSAEAPAAPAPAPSMTPGIPMAPLPDVGSQK